LTSHWRGSPNGSGPEKSSGEALRNKEERRAALACVRDVENVYSLPQSIVQVLNDPRGTSETWKSVWQLQVQNSLQFVAFVELSHDAARPDKKRPPVRSQRWGAASFTSRGVGASTSPTGEDGVGAVPDRSVDDS